MKVFISYSTVGDQKLALRLQALATVHGVPAYVPPAVTRQIPMSQLPEDVRTKLQESDVVLGLLMQHPLTDAVIREAELARSAGKLVIPIMNPYVVSGVPGYYEGLQPYVLHLPDPAQTIGEIVQLCKQRREIEGETTIVALAMLAVGLCLLELANVIDEDLMLANAGLESYREGLLREEQE